MSVSQVVQPAGRAGQPCPDCGSPLQRGGINGHGQRCVKCPNWQRCDWIGIDQRDIKED